VAVVVSAVVCLSLHWVPAPLAYPVGGGVRRVGRVLFHFPALSLLCSLRLFSVARSFLASHRGVALHLRHCKHRVTVLCPANRGTRAAAWGLVTRCTNYACLNVRCWCCVCSGAGSGLGSPSAAVAVAMCAVGGAPPLYAPSLLAVWSIPLLSALCRGVSWHRVSRADAHNFNLSTCTWLRKIFPVWKCCNLYMLCGALSIMM